MENSEEFKKIISEGEKELAYRNEELMAQHEELTAITEVLMQKNKHLESTLEELKSRNRELNQIVYRSSHDLKSPITTLQGLLNLLGCDDREVNRREYLARANEAVGDLLGKLSMLQSYGQLLVSELNYNVINVSSLWSALVREASKVPGYHQVHLTHSFATDEAFSTDYDKLFLIVFHLLHNAITFRTSEAAKVHVSIEVADNLLTVCVTDNGEGIAEEVLPQVTHMFYRGSAKATGAGLGLYLCQSAVNLLRGELCIESAVKEGTRVCVKIPGEGVSTD